MPTLNELVVSTRFAGRYSNPLDLDTPSVLIDLVIPTLGRGYLNGSGAQQASKYVTDRRTLATATETIDLAGGTDPKDAFGNNLSFLNIREILIANRATTSGFNLTVDGTFWPAVIPGFAMATDDIIIGPKGVLHFASPVDGYVVTPGTGDTIRLDSGVNTLDYDIIIVGI